MEFYAVPLLILILPRNTRKSGELYISSVFGTRIYRSTTNMCVCVWMLSPVQNSYLYDKMLSCDSRPVFNSALPRTRTHWMCECVENFVGLFKHVLSLVLSDHCSSIGFAGCLISGLRFHILYIIWTPNTHIHCLTIPLAISSRQSTRQHISDSLAWPDILLSLVLHAVAGEFIAAERIEPSCLVCKHTAHTYLWYRRRSQHQFDNKQ